MPRRRKRQDPSTFGLPVDQMRSGFFSDGSVSALRAVLGEGKKNPRATVQISGTTAGYLGGIDEAIAILKLGAEDWGAVTVQALTEGEHYDRWDTVLTIDGPVAGFAHLESLCLGVLSRRTRVCTNARHAVDAADSKPVILLGDRDDHFSLQPGDGFAAQAGGISFVSTEAQGSLAGGRRMASPSHAMIALCGGSTLGAVQALAATVSEQCDILAPVDYENDCVGTSLELARALDGRLWGVRLATPDTMIDRSVITQMGAFLPTGVNPQLVWNVRNALDGEGFGDVKIVASGGFDAARIRAFEEEGAPVDAYAVGPELHEGRYEFVADVVKADGKRQMRAGREERANPKLVKVS